MDAHILDRNPTRVNPGSDRRTSAPRAKPKSWTVRISPDVDLASIPPNIFKMAAVLERFYRTSPDCFPSNRTLAARYGCTVRQAQAIVAEMERRGFLVRDFEAGGRTKIRALRRLDLDLPVADADHEENCAPPTKFSAPPPRNLLRPHKNEDALNEDEFNNNGVVVDDLLDGEETTPEPERPSKAPGSPVDASPAPERTDHTTPASDAPGGDLGLLVARAASRFKATAEQTLTAVERYGFDRVLTAVYGVDHLEVWGGVIKACENWRRGERGGPDDRYVGLARRRLAESRPLPMYVPGWVRFTQTDEERAEAVEAVDGLKAMLAGVKAKGGRS